GDVGVGVRFWAVVVGVDPEVDPAARIGAAVEAFDVAGDVLRSDLDAAHRPFFQARGVDVEQAAVGGPVGGDLLDDLPGEHGGALKVQRLDLGVFQRHGDAGAAKESALDGRRHRAGIEDVDAGVRPGVEAADDQIRLLGQQLDQRQ